MIIVRLHLERRSNDGRYSYGRNIFPVDLFEVPPALEEKLTEIAGEYKSMPPNDFTLLKEIFDFLMPPPEGDRSPISGDPESDLVEREERLSREVAHLKKVKEHLLERLTKSDLSSTKSNLASIKRQKKELERELREYKSDFSKLETRCKNLESKLEREIAEKKELKGQINAGDRRFKDLELEYVKLLKNWNEFVPNYNAQENRHSEEIQSYIRNEQTLRRKSKELESSRDSLSVRVSELEEKVRSAEEKADIAAARLREQTVVPGIAGGNSRADKFKNDIMEFNRGLLRELSNDILKYWRLQEPKLSQRSPEFRSIQSVLSQCVFVDGMSLYSQGTEGDRLKAAGAARAILSDMFGTEEFGRLSKPVLEDLQQKIVIAMLDYKEVKESSSESASPVDEILLAVMSGLERVKSFSLSPEIDKKIRYFVEQGFRLLQDVMRDPQQCEFFLPEVGESFDEALHEAVRSESEGVVECAMCVGYRIAGIVSVKASVFTVERIPETDADKLESDTSREQVSVQAAVSGEVTSGNTLPKTGGIDCASPSGSAENLDDAANREPSSSTEGEGPASGIYLVEFEGTVITGAAYRTKPSSDERYKTSKTFIPASATSGGRNPRINTITFDAWIHGDSLTSSVTDRTDDRWYRDSKHQLWLPAAVIEGGPPTTAESNPTENKDNDDEPE